MGVSIIDFGHGSVIFFNGTPHAINLMAGAEYKKDVRKHVGGSQVAAIPASGVMLSAQLETVPVSDLGSGITVAEQRVVSCDPLPSAALRADYVIVSAMYATAYRKLHGEDGVKLVTIRDLVVDEETKAPRGCLGFALA